MLLIIQLTSLDKKDPSYIVVEFAKMGAKKGHVVCVPYPAQGHVTPMMQLANLLHARGFHVTYVNTEFNHKRWMRAKGEDYFKGLPDFRFETIRDGLPPSDKDATQDIEALCHSTQKACLGPFVELVKKLNSSSQVPPVTCIISDGVMSFGVEAGRELGIPQVQFWTSPICGFMAFLQYSELVKRGIFPLKDENFMNDGTLDTPIDWIPGMKNMRLRDFPSYVRSTDRNDIMFNFMGSEAENCLGSSGIIFNTFNSFEQEVLEALSTRYPNIYTIGPLPLLTRHFPDSKFGSIRTSLWKEDTECLQWLDKWEPESVLYVSYGSITVMTEEHLNEFAWGLANSKHPFLWVVRPDVVMGDSASLPEEFFEEIKDRGMLAHWCPQDKVLNHPSVGAFLTHCGWNSMVESVCGGVPVMCWPFFSEQQTNCRYACVEWGVGVEVSPDVKREELEEQVKEMMGGSEGKRMRERAHEWKKKAVEATEVGGSSYNDFERVIKDLLHREI